MVGKLSKAPLLLFTLFIKISLFVGLSKPSVSASLQKVSKALSGFKSLNSMQQIELILSFKLSMRVSKLNFSRTM